ncbi:hypothetical protein M9H77_34801 [Catharanthus roseus]|uniref:Uncharacterized protein n=1 Tax=Catharanthus roseus TaxID=4058 RepID=A0ACB9ZNE7_CATRO|nr:hypothetical protein M9H77_34801 [Catharanthus roseus]
MGKKNSTTLLQFFVPLLLVFCYLGVCIAINNITITQPLRHSETLFSSNQTFKLGFFSPTNTTNHYVGIMFNLPVMTVIWVANRENPLNDSSGTFTISEDGNLVVLNDYKQILWSSNVSNLSANCTANLMDTGNLVLQENGRTVWESFQNPTDSFVNNMRITAASRTDEKKRLSSWKSPSDPSVGDFSHGLEILQTAQIIIWKRNEIYWRSGPWNGVLFIGIPIMNSVYNNGFEVVGDRPDDGYFSFKFSDGLSLLYYQLTSDGTIVEKVWVEGNKDWLVTSSTVPTECDVYGKCGPFGSCKAGDSPICKCLKGFEPRDKEEWDKGNWTGGCTRKKPLQQCGRNITAADQDGFLKLGGVKVPDLAQWKSNLQDDCDTSCLKNCSCVAYAYYRGLGCVHWSGNLIDIQQFSVGGADLYVRLAYSELENKKDMKVIISSVVVVGFLALAGSAYVCWKFFAKHRGKKQECLQSLVEAMDLHGIENDLPLYTYEALASATDNFHSGNKLGKGGFGQVFKGKLLDGQEIAVKRLSKSSGQGINEFINEVVLISRLQHRNLVKLLGCCVEKEEKMLVYELLPNGSLDSYIFDSSKQDLLEWNRRVLIIQGIGRGLLYLHRDSRLKIIHRDLKASNILLDEELNAKISDFGLARILGGKQDQDNTTRVVGTYGYMSPEYAMLGRFSEKSDIYSFGILLLEIVTGRRNSGYSHGEDEICLSRYAWEMWNAGDVMKLTNMTSVLEANIEMEILRYVNVGLLCVQEEEKDRPNVSAILSMLNSEISELPHPKLPAFTGKMVTSKSELSQQRVYSVNNCTVSIIQAR